MSDLETLENAIANGYHVLNFDCTLQAVQKQHADYLKTGYKAENIDAFISVFDVKTERNVLLDPKNSHKALILLKNGSQQIEIMTSDTECIERAQKQRLFQNEFVEIFMQADCFAFGGSSDPEQVIHVSQITAQLQGFSGWSFQDTGVGKFSATKKIDSIDEDDGRNELEKLSYLLDYISLTRQIGIQVERSTISRVPRFGPTHGPWGPTEYNVPPLTKEELQNFPNYLKSSKQVFDITKGLHQTYLLKSLNSRLALLWAITEATFTDKPKPLLTSEEINAIVEYATKIPTLKEDAGRVSELRKVLSDPNRLPCKSRNERISENIANSLELDKIQVCKQIKRASTVRGKYLHELKSDLGDIREAEIDLRSNLEKISEKQFKRLILPDFAFVV